MLRNSLKIEDTTKKEFLELIYFKSDKKYDKILPWKFQHSSEPFNMLTVHKLYATVFFRHLNNPASCSLKF